MNATLPNPLDQDQGVALAHDDVEPPFDDCFDDDDDDGGGGGGDGDRSRWVTVASFWSIEQAHLARLKVEAEDIPCVLDNENVVSMNWLYANAVGGVRVRVPEVDTARARQVLGLPPIETPDERAAGESIVRLIRDTLRSVRRAAGRAVELLFFRRSAHRGR